MSTPSSIDKLPDEVRALIGQLRQQNWTIDQILAHLRELLDKAPSRSAIARHVKGMERVAERVRRSRDVAEALVTKFGEKPEGQTARLNIELMHSVILDLFMANDGSTLDENGEPKVVSSDPEDIMFLCKALDHLAGAGKKTADLLLQAKKEGAAMAKAAAVAEVAKVAKEQGLSTETANILRARLLGLKIDFGSKADAV